MIIISACLCGIATRYDGGSNLNEEALNLLRKGEAVLVCPEQLGGLCTPREACEITGGTGIDVLNGKARVVTKSGVDCTKQFIKGAEETLKIAREVGATAAFLKAKSPSCGFGEIYDGSFSKKRISGNGVTAELLIKNNIKVFNE